MMKEEKKTAGTVDDGRITMILKGFTHRVGLVYVQQ